MLRRGSSFAVVVCLAVPACTGSDPAECVPDDPPALQSVETCPGATGYELPEDPAAPGPWPVGVRTVSVGELSVEVWYPAQPGSEACAAPAEYDIRAHLPDEQAAKISDEEAPRQPCECYRDLPLDTAQGPYPVLLWAHGFASFRTLSLSTMVHYASRGIVVLATDHPGLTLRDMVGFLTVYDYPMPEEDQTGDLRAMAVAVSSPAGDLAFLDGHIDADRLGAAGHSAGGRGVSPLGDMARAVISIASLGTEAGAALQTSLLLGGLRDGIVPFTETTDAYADTPAPKRLLGIDRAGHSLPTDLCLIGADRGGMYQIAIDAGIDDIEAFQSLATDGCGEDYLDAERGLEIVRALTTATLETHLSCAPGEEDTYTGLLERFTEASVYQVD